MAVSRRNAQTNQNNAGATTLVVTKPTGLADGDLLVATCFVNADSSAITMTTGGATWTLLSGQLWTNSANGAGTETMGLFYKVVTSAASEPASYTFNFGGQTRKAAGAVVAYQGVDTSNPIADWVVDNTGIGVFNQDYPNSVYNGFLLAPTTPEFLVGFIGTNQSTTFSVASGTITEFFDITSGGGGGATSKVTLAGYENTAPTTYTFPSTDVSFPNQRIITAAGGGGSAIAAAPAVTTASTVSFGLALQASGSAIVAEPVNFGVDFSANEIVRGALDYRNDTSKYIVNRSNRAYSPVHMGSGRFVGGGGYIADPVNADQAKIWAFKSLTDFSGWTDEFSSGLSVQATYGGGSVKVIKINDNGVVFHMHNIGRIDASSVACDWVVVGASLYNSTTHTLSAPSGRTQIQQSGGCSVANEGIYRFSDDRALVTYNHDSVTYIHGYQLNATTGAIIAQPARTTYQAGFVEAKICTLDESTVALAAHLNGSDIVARVLSVSSGAVVTLGSDNTLAAGATALDLLPIDSTHAYAIYTNTTGNQVYRVLTISGNTVTFGSETLLWTRGTIPDGPYGDACYLGANKYGFLDTSGVGASTQMIWVFARNTGTNALEFESNRGVPDPVNMQDQTIFRVDDTHFGIGWYSYAGFSVASTSAYYPKVQIYTTAVDPPAPTYLHSSSAVAAAATGTTLATTTIMPSGVRPGDLLIMSVAASAADTITTPTGYTPIVTAVSNASLSHGWYWREATADASDTPTITFSTTATSSHGHYARIYAFKNALMASPFEDATVTSVTTSNAPTGDAVATSASNRLEVHLVAVDAAASWSGGGMPPSGFSQIGLVASTLGADIMMDGIHKSRPTSGAGSSTALGTMSGSHPWAVLSLALKPANAPTDHTATITDPIGITDAAAGQITATFSKIDPVGLLDSITWITTSARAPPETIGILDGTPTQVSAAQRSRDDTIGILDSRTETFTPGVQNFTQTITDPVGLLDSPTQVSTIIRSRDDVVGILDVADRVVERFFVLTDLIGLLDSKDATLSLARSTDLVGMLDSIGVVATTVRSATDPVNLLDSFSQVGANNGSSTDPVGILDSISVVLTSVRSRDDVVGLLDSVAGVLTVLITVTDPIGLLDSRTQDSGTEFMVTVSRVAQVAVLV